MPIKRKARTFRQGTFVANVSEKEFVVEIQFVIKPSNYHGVPDTEHGAKRIVRAMLAGEADFPRRKEVHLTLF